MIQELWQSIKRKWKVLQILSEPENLKLFERIVNERELRMKTVQELLALKRELEVIIINLSKDEQFHEMQDHAEAKLDTLKGRLRFVNEAINNFALYDWIFNSNTTITRTDIVDASKIVIYHAT